MKFKVLILLIMATYCKCSCDDLQIAKCWFVSTMEVKPGPDIQKFHRLQIIFHPSCSKPNESIDLEIKIYDSATNQYLPNAEHISCGLQEGSPCVHWISTVNMLKVSQNYTVDIGPRNCQGWRSKDIPLRVPVKKKMLNSNKEMASGVLAIKIAVATVLPLTAIVITVVVCRRKLWRRSRGGCYICVSEGNDDPLAFTNPSNDLTLSNLQRIFVASFPLPLADMNEDIENLIHMLRSKYTRTTNLRSNDLNLMLTISTQLKDSDHIILLVTDRLLELWTVSGVSTNGTHDYQMIYMLKEIEILSSKPLHIVDFTSTVEQKESLQQKLRSRGISVCYDFRSRTSDFTLLLEQLSKANVT